MQTSMVKIRVAWQTEPKLVPGDTLVFVNKYIDVRKRARDLQKGDYFLFNGGWYVVESVELV